MKPHVAQRDLAGQGKRPTPLRRGRAAIHPRYRARAGWQERYAIAP